MLPGLPERNPGLELANAFSVRDQEFPPAGEVVLTSLSSRSSECSRPLLLVQQLKGASPKSGFGARA